MSTFPNRPPTKTRRSPTPQWGYTAPIPEKKTNWILWTLLGIALVAAGGGVAWRMQYQANWQQNDDKVMALLASADQLIQENREDEAEAVVKQGIGLLPGDSRCQQMIERINTKRKMIYERKAEASDAALAEAEQLAKNDIDLAIDALGKIVSDASLTPEARKAAEARIASFKRGVCSLRLPEDWPGDAILTLDDITKEVVKGLVGGILTGKRTVKISRFGFREPPPVELDFRGVDPVPLPTIEWKLRGAKVFVKSRPAGAAVWRQGKNTGKVTPCELEDVDDGPIELLLKHPDYTATPIKGEVKDRKPLSLTVTLTPLDAPAP